MQRLLAITWLTWKAAFRFRFFLVLAALLLASVVGLPLLIKDDGTARGFTQILLTYTLSTITTLLGLSTLWLSCGALAREIEECQMQVLAVKPIARWQIWLGKWLGIMSLNAVLLALAGTCVYCLLLWRADRLPADQRQVLRNEVLVARGSAKHRNMDREIAEQTEQTLRERLKEHPVDPGDVPEVRKNIRAQVVAEHEAVPPGYSRSWEINLGAARRFLKDQPLFLRVKFNSSEKSPSGTFLGVWGLGVPQKTPVWQSEVMSLAPDTFHEFQVPANYFDQNGVLTITFGNANNATLLFPLDDGIEVLYREGGFGPNFARGLGVILCWMGLLAALGLMSASFLSFPVATFFSLGMLAVVLASGTMSNVIEEGTIAGFNAEKGTKGSSIVDPVVIPTFKAVLKIIRMAEDYSPIDSLSTGRNISWDQLALAFSQIVLILGGAFALIGIIAFTRRELATAQGTQ